MCYLFFLFNFFISVYLRVTVKCIFIAIFSVFISLCYYYAFLLSLVILLTIDFDGNIFI